MSLSGKAIKVGLLEINKSQLWLLKELKRNGFSTLAKGYLCQMLNGKVSTPYANAVLRKSLEIIAKK